MKDTVLTTFDEIIDLTLEQRTLQKKVLKKSIEKIIGIEIK